MSFESIPSPHTTYTHTHSHPPPPHPSHSSHLPTQGSRLQGQACDLSKRKRAASFETFGSGPAADWAPVPESATAKVGFNSNVLALIAAVLVVVLTIGLIAHLNKIKQQHKATHAAEQQAYHNLVISAPMLAARAYKKRYPPSPLPPKLHHTLARYGWCRPETRPDMVFWRITGSSHASERSMCG